MDLAFNPHAERARRKNRSSTNINHLTLAPLTVKLPINSDDEPPVDAAAAGLAPSRSTSYIQGKSAPTTPRLLSRSPAGPRSRSHHRRTPSAPGVPVSKSATHLATSRSSRSSVHGSLTPGQGLRRHKGDDGEQLREANDSDWLLRTGAIMSTETREYKGQSWLVSRQSSTSLHGMRDDEDDAFERELALEREMTSRRVSRRGSAAVVDDDDYVTPYGSRYASQVGSRSHSVAGHRSDVFTPMDRDAQDSYFSGEQAISGPDFVNLDEKLEELERDTSQEDEAAVRRLVRHGQNGQGSWISNMIGWSLFSLEENDEDDEEDEDNSIGDAASQTGRSGKSFRHFEGISNLPEDSLPPPKGDEGAWKDAAWLLSVATRVMF